MCIHLIRSTLTHRIRGTLSNERIRLNRLSNKVSIQAMSFNDSSGLSIDPLIDWFYAHFAFAQYAFGET